MRRWAGGTLAALGLSVGAELAQTSATGLAEAQFAPPSTWFEMSAVVVPPSGTQLSEKMTAPKSKKASRGIVLLDRLQRLLGEQTHRLEDYRKLSGEAHGSSVAPEMEAHISRLERHLDRTRADVQLLTPVLSISDTTSSVH